MFWVYCHSAGRCWSSLRCSLFQLSSACLCIFLPAATLQDGPWQGVMAGEVAKPRYFLPLYCCQSRSGELRTQKLKSHLIRTQSLEVLPLKPGVGQYIAMHATLTTVDFFLAKFLPFHSIHLHFFKKPLPSFFSCISCG